jgi:hypothetical protein
MAAGQGVGAKSAAQERATVRIIVTRFMIADYDTRGALRGCKNLCGREPLDRESTPAFWLR